MESFSIVHEIEHETFDDCIILPWWKEGRLTVCRVNWTTYGSVDDCQQFYHALRDILPHGTKVFGCARSLERGVVSYTIILGFRCRLVTGAGFDKLIASSSYFQTRPPLLVSEAYLDFGDDIGACVERLQDKIQCVGGNCLFGEPLGVEDGGDQVLPLFKNLGCMRNALKKVPQDKSISTLLWEWTEVSDSLFWYLLLVCYVVTFLNWVVWFFCVFIS